ncbi:hypothetical protein [Pseudochryseolinea flava]|nr:hypothetical protein [Pseudochryseolinea flava]
MIRSSVIGLLLLIGCVPEGVKDRINENMENAENLLADQEFKRAIANVELHKLRFGSYPESLDDLKFLSVMDSSMRHFVQYHKLDSGYAMNVVVEFPAFGGGEANKMSLRYPQEFWNGLGCVKSNIKEK